jgi:hypothetical protein
LKSSTFIGETETGEAIFYCPDDRSIAIEKDHQYLVVPTPEELKQIYNKFPEL